METIDEAKNKNIAAIDTVIEERYKKEKEFHESRTIFYFDKKDGIHFAPKQFENSSHDEWFKAEKIDIEKVIRGYIKNSNAYCYIGKDFRIPNLTINQYFVLKDNLRCWNVYLGLNVKEIGEEWKPIHEICIYNE